MNSIEKTPNSNICSKITQIETDLEATLNKIFAQAGEQIKLEKQAEYTQAIEGTKQVFHRFKSKYGCLLSTTKTTNNY